MELNSSGATARTTAQRSSFHPDARLLRSFWMAGYEGADHINAAGTVIDMGVLTDHERQAQRDYELLREFGIATVRESVGWRLVERNNRFDFSPLLRRIEAARACDIQILWTLCHFGWPDDADIFDDSWIDRFVRYCDAVARFLADCQLPGATAIYTPINEISFLTWAICEGSVIHRHSGTRPQGGHEVKKRLVRAAIAGSEAIWNVDPNARLLNVDPVIYIVSQQPERAGNARPVDEFQYEAWDMLAGRSEPQLGGADKYLDIVGINYYHSNQWEHETGDRLFWHLRDPRRIPFRKLMAAVYQRYRHPFLISETSHVGVGRGEWIREIGDEVIATLTAGLPLLGVCLYPIVDRPDWNDFNHWHNSGLWDLESVNGQLERRLCVEYARDLLAVQAATASALESLQES